MFHAAPLTWPSSLAKLARGRARQGVSLTTPVLRPGSTRLTREFRWNVGLPGAVAPGDAPNRWAGEPLVEGWALPLRVRVTVAGLPDARTGYAADIRVLDAAVRSALERVGFDSLPAPAHLLVRLWEGLRGTVRPAALCGLSLLQAPQIEWSVTLESQPLIRRTESFEFSASHRLHCPALSDDENRRIFGKCNNPGGHGHNYVVDVTIEGRPDERTGLLMPAGALQAAVQRELIARFDHRHLNQDCPEFQGLNPSVENIARVAHRLLHDKLPGARLANVRVWETAKTWADYGEPPAVPAD